MTQEVKDFFSTYSDFVAKVTSEPSMDLDALKRSFDDIENNSNIKKGNIHHGYRYPQFIDIDIHNS